MTLPLPTEATGLPADTLMRTGRTYRVICRGGTHDAVSAAMEEMRRHMALSTALFGLIDTYPVIVWDGAAGRWKGTASGSTYRAPDDCYTVGELRAAMLGAYRSADPAGPVGLIPGIVEVHAAEALPLDTAPAGSGAGETADAVADVGRATADVARAAGRAATGAGDLLAGAGEGAAGVGAAVGSAPLLAFATTVLLVGGTAWLYLKATR